MSTYRQQLRHRKWQQRRLQIFERDGWLCTRCADIDDSVELHVHHLKYYRGRSPWEYTDEELTTLCDVCHRIEHGHLNHKGEIPLNPTASGIVVSCDVVDEFIVPGTVLMWLGTSAREEHPNKDPLWECRHPRTGEIQYMDASTHELFRSAGLTGEAFIAWVQTCVCEAFDNRQIR
jgi:hypothetical protein